MAVPIALENGRENVRSPVATSSKPATMETISSNQAETLAACRSACWLTRLHC